MNALNALRLRLVLRMLALAPVLALALLGPAQPAAADDGLLLAVPFVSQDDGTPYAGANCGPASVAMVLRALGVNASVTTLRQAVNRIQGISSYDAGTAITTVGALLQAEELAPAGLLPGQRTVPWTADALLQQLRSAHPVIAEVRFRLLPGHSDAPADQDHYVVLVGIDGGSVLYHDPALPGPNETPRAMPLATLTAAMAASGHPFAAVTPTQGAFPVVVAAAPPSPPAAPVREGSTVPLVDLKPWRPAPIAPPPPNPLGWWVLGGALLAAVAGGAIYALARRSGPVGLVTFVGPRGERLGQLDLHGRPHAVRWNAETCARNLSSLDLVALRIKRGPNVAGLTTVQLSLVDGAGHAFARILQDGDCLPVANEGGPKGSGPSGSGPLVAYRAALAGSTTVRQLEEPFPGQAKWPAGGYQHLQPRGVA